MVIIVLGSVIFFLLFIFGTIQLYKKSDMGNSFMLRYIVQKHGPYLHRDN